MSYNIRYRPIILSLLLLIGYLIAFFIGLFDSLDSMIYQFLISYNSVPITSFMIAVTFFGSGVAVVTFCLICLIVDFNKGLVISANMIIVWLLNYMIKYIVARPRPSVPHLVMEDGFSFPSCHAMIAFALFGLIAYFLWNKYKILSVIFMFIAVLVGISRIYLGVHYTSDVLGGFLVSLCYLCVIIPILKYHKRLSDT